MPPRILRCRSEVREKIIEYCRKEMRRKNSDEIAFSTYLQAEDIGFPSYLLISVCKALALDDDGELRFEQVSKKGAFIVRRNMPVALVRDAPQTAFPVGG
jgi:hypothetical protein